MNIRRLIHSFLQWIRDNPYLFTAIGIVTVVIFSVGTVYIANNLRKSAPAPVCTGLTCVTDTADPERDKALQASVSPTPTPEIKGENLLNGSEIDSSKANLRPLAVMIENSPEARPQSGLQSADIVYEAIAEGGITRFMAVYADPTSPVKVGPVRSARTYFVDFATELGALYAHVGGNMDALDQLLTQKEVGNLDQFSIGAPTFQRENPRNIATEHTMYSSTEKLWNIATARNYSLTPSFDSWKFTSAAPVGSPATAVTVNFSSAQFKVIWNYSADSKLYSRTMAGAPHIDANSNQQITASTIVLQVVANTPVVTRINEEGWRYTLTGSGKATVIRDGVSIPATWKKTGTERTRYYDEANNEIPMAKGKIWVEIIHPTTVTAIN